LIDARQIIRSEFDQQRNTPECAQGSDNAARKRQQQTFGQQALDESSPARAESDANRELLRA
jgi:hypothetical protein